MTNTRAQTLAHLRENPGVQVLIVGGGINGVGLLRELALQSVDVLLVEKDDYGAGASAGSTRVIHGGLRYLENFELRLVRESLHERNRLIRNAPHTVRPLPTTIPITNWTGGITHVIKKFLRIPSKPGGRGALTIKIGLALYDLLTFWERDLPTHSFAGRKTALELRPALNPAIVCTATYFDASITYPERLCLELVLDAETAGARALNYACVESAAGNSVIIRDEITGERITVTPQIVVNATGAWIDFTNQALKQPSRFIGGTKGSHLVLEHAELLDATQGGMLYFENRDGRICIFYRVADRVIAGTTDIPVDDPKALCEEDEVEYILDSIRQVFPTIKVGREHIVYRFCGVRPLPRSDAVTTGQISRDHSAPLTPPGNGIDFPIYSLIGGKWTTFRAFAEQVTDELLPKLSMTRQKSTADLPIGGGKNYPTIDRLDWIDTRTAKSGLPAGQIAMLLDRYGSRAAEVIKYLIAAPDAPLESNSDYTQREILFMVEREYSLHIEDVLMRRTLLALLGQLSEALVEEIAGIMAGALGWTAAQTQVEIKRTLRVLEIKGRRAAVTYNLTPADEKRVSFPLSIGERTKLSALALR